MVFKLSSNLNNFDFALEKFLVVAAKLTKTADGGWIWSKCNNFCS